MKRKKIVLLLMAAASAFLLGACKQGRGPEEKEHLASEIQEEDIGSEIEVDAYEKGYNLPVNDEERKESEIDCKEAMDRIREIYKNADKGNALNAVISDETAGQMIEVQKAIGCPVSASRFHFNMCNYEKMETFLKDSLNGKEGEIVTYEIYSGGNIGRMKFIYDGTDMYGLYTNATWSDENEPMITSTSYSRIKEWEYTEKGWFIFEYCVPEPPEVSEIVNGNAMIRVKPLKEEYGEIAVKYLLALGYQGNNLLCSNWNAEHMEDIDYNGLFQYLYSIKYQQQFDSEQYAEGIPKEEFENMMLEYLPVTAEEIQQYAIFDSESQTYRLEMLGCGNYAPNEFGTSTPEVTDIKENEAGTVTLTIDAVCEMAGSEAVMSHKLTVQFLEDGGIRYLKNRILDDGMDRMPAYQYRFGRGN